MSTHFSSVGRKLAAFAATVVLCLGFAQGANAAVVYTANLDASNGGQLNGTSPDLFNGFIRATSGTANLTTSSLSDGLNPGTRTSVGPASRSFAFDYLFSLSSNASVQAYSLQTSGTAISNFTLSLYKLGETTPLITGLSGSGADGRLVLSFSNLLPDTTYVIQIAGTLANGFTNGKFSGSISTVPLPGALAMFAAGLAGLGFVARRRRSGVGANKPAALTPARTKALAGSIAGAAVLALGLMVSAPRSAEAAIVETVDMGNLDVSTTGLYLNGQIKTSGAPRSSGYYTLDTDINGGLQTGTASGSGSNAISYVYQFTLTKAASIVMNLSASANLNLESGSFALFSGLYDATKSSLISSTYSSSQPGTLQIDAANLAAGTYYFKIDSAFITNSSVTGVGDVSAVPLPGALMMFGSGLVGLAAFSFRRRNKMA